jgi:hypothetical protein
MHPVWVIRASRTAFALCPNRESSSNVCHKRPLSTVIFRPLFYPLLSSLITPVRNPSSAPNRRPLPTQPNYPPCGIFVRTSCPLKESDHLATVPSYHSIGRLCRSSSVLVEAGHFSLRTRWTLIYVCPEFPRWLHPKHICGQRTDARTSHSLAPYSAD